MGNRDPNRTAWCTDCENSFEYYEGDWPRGIEPSHCQVCGAHGPDIETNYLVNPGEDDTASRMKVRAQEALIAGRDPVEVLLESDGWNEAKDLAERAPSSELAESRLEYVRQNLAAGVPPFVDPRSNPRTA